MLALLLGLIAVRAPTQYGPSSNAIALQSAIDSSIVHGAPGLSVAPGHYYFGNSSLVIHRASNFALQARAGPGSVHLWFSIGAGVLVNQSSDVVLEGF